MLTSSIASPFQLRPQHLFALPISPLFYLILYLSLLFIQPANAGSLIDKYPHTSEYLLDSGETVALPLRVDSLQGIALLGTLSCEKAAASIDVPNLYPLKISNEQCLGVIYALNYLEGSLGPYSEVITLLGVTADPNAAPLTGLLSFGVTFAPELKDLLEGKLPQAGMLFQEIALTSQYAVDAGIEIWGIPKVLEPGISVDIFDWGTTIDVQSSLFSFHLEKTLWVPFFASMKLDSWTPLAPHPATTRFQTLLKGFTTLGPVLSTSYFQFGSVLHELDFKPYLWQHIWKGTDAVFFEGDVPE